MSETVRPDYTKAVAGFAEFERLPVATRDRQFWQNSLPLLVDNVLRGGLDRDMSFSEIQADSNIFRRAAELAGIHGNSTQERFFRTLARGTEPSVDLKPPTLIRRKLGHVSRRAG